MKAAVSCTRKDLPCEYILWLILAVTFSLVFVSYTVDDAFISFRYAYNLIHYGIWNYNPDREYVEAYTSFLYTFLAIIPHWVGMSPMVFFKIIGLLLLLRLIWRLHSFCADRRTRFVFTLLILGNTYTYIHIYSCLETPLFMVLCVELFAWLAENKQDPRKFYCLLLLLPLTRPDGGLLSVLALLYYGWRSKGRIIYPTFLASVIAFGVMYFMWRYWYFGYLLPNTFYAKRLEEFTLASVIIKLASIIFYLGVISSLMMWINRRDFTFLGCSAFATYALAYLPCANWMNYADRFAFQLFIPVMLVSAFYVQHFSKQNFYKVCTALSVAIIFVNADIRVGRKLSVYGQLNFYSHRFFGEVLAPFKSKGYTIMLSDVGAIPYYSGWKTYDSFALANTTIAHQGNSIAYMQTISPDMILLTLQTPYGSHVKENEWESSIVVDYRQDIIYQYIQASHLYKKVAFLPFSQNYLHAVFIKESLPDFAELQHLALQSAEQSERFSQKDWREQARPHLKYLQ